MYIHTYIIYACLENIVVTAFGFYFEITEFYCPKPTEFSTAQTDVGRHGRHFNVECSFSGASRPNGG